MSHSASPFTTAVGLLAGPVELARFRAQLNHPRLAPSWRRFVAAATTAGAAVNCDTAAFIAAITDDPAWRARAVQSALTDAHQPIGQWIHHEAGCMTLGGMDRAYRLALGIDWLWPHLNRDQREALVGALVAKSVANRRPLPDGLRYEADGLGQLLFARRLDIHDPCCLHPTDTAVNNWDLWFASCLYMGAALAERAWLEPQPGEPPLTWGRYYDVGYDMTPAMVARWKEIAQERITTALANQIGPDGDYAEGANYAAYGGEALMTGLALLERHEGDNRFGGGVAKLPDWLRDQVVADLDFGIFNFNDATLAWRPALAVLAHVASRTRSPKHVAMLHEALDASDIAPPLLAMLAIADTLDVEPSSSVVLTSASASVYRRVGEVIWRSGGGRDGVNVAMLCGAHGGAHQHRDRGTFWLSAFGERFIVDTGDCRYVSPPYPAFADTIAHSCILVDGRGQVGDNANPVAGELIEHRVVTTSPATACAGDEKRDHGGCRTPSVVGVEALFDASACYPGIARYTRRLTATLEDITLTDAVESGSNNPGVREITWLAQGYNLDGLASWRFAGRRATLSRPGGELHIEFDRDPTSCVVTAAPVDGKATGILRLAVTFGYAKNPPAGDVSLTARLRPERTAPMP